MKVFRYSEKINKNIMEFVVAAKAQDEAIKLFDIKYADFYRNGMETKDDYCLDIALANPRVVHVRQAGSGDALRPLEKTESLMEIRLKSVQDAASKSVGG